MKKMLFIVVLVSLNLSSYSSTQSDRNKRIACTITGLFLPATLLASPAVFASATAMWSQACIGGKPGGSTTVFKKEF